MNYKYRDDEEIMYSDEYSLHVNAMTAEKLHSKSQIAMELAGRDIRIKELEQALEGRIVRITAEEPAPDTWPDNEQSRVLCYDSVANNWIEGVYFNVNDKPRKIYALDYRTHKGE